jgi:hemoglobin
MAEPPPGPARRHDITTPDDVHLLVRRFYQAAIPDPLLGPVFHAAGIDWGAHVPLLFQFWEHQLLGPAGYEGNVVRAHAEAWARAPFGPAELARWVELFEETVDEYFAGPVAERAKRRAREVAEAIAPAIARRWRASDHTEASRLRA